MKKVYLTRKTHFSAAHKLWNDSWSEEKNKEVFGACANPNYHGHNFDMFVTLVGSPDPDTGFVINLKDLNQIFKEHIIEIIDHKNINLDVHFMKGVIPTTENLAIGIWEQLKPLVENEHRKLYCVKLYETENNFVEYYGENP
ncbi:MAG: 6-carboxytetrahydropterin synthase [Flavobacteriales bacterium]